MRYLWLLWLFFRRTRGPLPPKVGHAQQQDALLAPPSVSDNNEESNVDHGNDDNGGKLYLKSSLKKPDCVPVVREDDDLPRASGVKENDVPGGTGRRKVQWTDSCGNDLVEVREFELSELSAWDEEYEQESGRTCACVIM